MTGPTGSGGPSGPTGGAWPIWDVIMMADYSNPIAATQQNPVVSNISDRFLRIHMDVYYDPTDNIEGLIKGGKLKDAYDKIVAFNDPQGKQAGSPGSKLLALVFGQ